MEWNSDFNTDLEFSEQPEKYTKIELKKRYPNTKGFLDIIKNMI